eukprot:TRINITY_DN6894_c0_g3_i1.p1 TRINITY_DN6894_c0_g3~~TRINITY_DN6894_c0_g3_i1.p1  ORF type:complete len:1371 (+),score=382.29 TRINITY_DN6894_c0_g3_i1:112-4224(+)
MDEGDEDLVADFGDDVAQSCPTDLSLRGIGRRVETSRGNATRIPSTRQQQQQLQMLSNAYPAEYFTSLGASAAEMLCLVVDEELLTDGLRSVPFYEVLFLDDFGEEQLSQCQWDAEVTLILIVCLQTDKLKHQVAMKCCQAVSTNESSPATLLVLVPPPGGRQSCQPYVEAQVEFLHGGADDVIALQPGQPMNPQQAQLITHRTEIIAQRAKHLIDDVVRRFERKQKMVLNLAVRRFVWSMPGSSLSHIPPADSSLYEWMEMPGKDGKDEQQGGAGRRDTGEGSERGGRGAVGGVGAFVFTQLLGKGGFGCVFKARHPEQGTVAIKCIDKRSVRDAHGLFSLDREFCTICSLPRHKNVCHATAILHGEQGLYVVMEYAGKMSLQDFTIHMKREGHNVLPDNLVTSFFTQEAAAVHHLHEAKVCHRDLKPKNFVVSDDEVPSLQLTDFGLAAQICGSQLCSEACGSLPFCAPEVLRNNFTHSPYSGMAADAWSLGVNFLELIHGAWSIEKFLDWVPAAPKGSENTVRDIEKLEATFQKIPKKGPPAFCRVIEKLLKVWPEGRWNMTQVCGPEGLNLLGDPWAGKQIVPPKGAPDRAKGRSFKTLTTCSSCANGKPKLKLSKTVTMDTASPLVEQLGDISGIRLILDDFFDNVFAHPLLGGCFKSSSSSRRSPAAPCKRGMSLLLHSQLDPPALQQTLQKLAVIHSDLNISHLHFDAFVDTFKASLQSLEAPEIGRERAVNLVEKVRVNIISNSLVRSMRASEVNTSSWRKDEFPQIMQKYNRKQAFCAQFQKSLQSDKKLSNTFLGEWSERDIEEHILSAVQRGKVPSFQEALEEDALFEAFSRLLFDSLLESGWPVKTAEVIFFTFVQERERAMLLKGLQKATGVIKSPEWKAARSKIQEHLAEDSVTQFFAESPRLPKCLQAIGHLLGDGGSLDGLDPSVLAEAHQDLGMTSTHFNMFLKAFGAGLKEHAGDSEVKAAVNAVKLLMPWVLETSAYRQSLAVMEEANTWAIKEDGEVVAARCHERFAQLRNLLSKDKRLRMFFKGTEDDAWKKQTDFCKKIFGGFPVQKDRARAMLALDHKSIRVSDYHFDCFMSNVRSVLVHTDDEGGTGGEGQQGPAPMDVQRFLGRMELLREHIVTDAVAHDEEESKSSCESEDIATIVDFALKLASSSSLSAGDRGGILHAPCRKLGMQQFLKRAIHAESASELSALAEDHPKLKVSPAQFDCLTDALATSMRKHNMPGRAVTNVQDALSSLKHVIVGDPSGAVLRESQRRLLVQQLSNRETCKKYVDRVQDLLREDTENASPATGGYSPHHCSDVDGLLSPFIKTTGSAASIQEDAVAACANSANVAPGGWRGESKESRCFNSYG